MPLAPKTIEISKFQRVMHCTAMRKNEYDLDKTVEQNNNKI